MMIVKPWVNSNTKLTRLGWRHHLLHIIFCSYLQGLFEMTKMLVLKWDSQILSSYESSKAHNFLISYPNLTFLRLNLHSLKISYRCHIKFLNQIWFDISKCHLSDWKSFWKLTHNTSNGNNYVTNLFFEKIWPHFIIVLLKNFFNNLKKAKNEFIAFQNSQLPKQEINWGSSLALPQTSLSSRDHVLIFALN